MLLFFLLLLVSSLHVAVTGFCAIHPILATSRTPRTRLDGSATDGGSFASAWYRDKPLPFECTSCGKCCTSSGSVWMSPEDIANASDLLGLSVPAFIDTYASHTLQDNDDDLSTWVRLRSSSTDQDQCVFLIDSTRTCQIYQARPSQCSTFPFWSNIMDSQDSWNDHVRLPDGEDDESPIPYWTTEMGGCEGMKLMKEEEESLDTTTATTTAATPRVVVDPYLVYQILQEHERDEERFPGGGIVTAIGNVTRSCWDDDD